MAGRRKVCSCCTAVVSISVLVSVGVILICLGAASVPLFDSLYAKELKKKMVLKKGSESYDNWRVPPVPIYMKFYIFNYTNVDEFLATEVNPNVAERGPYSYRELLVNEVIEEDDYAITYLANKTYVFDPTTSCEDCRENDTLTVVNVAILTLMEMLKDLNIKNPGWVLKGMLELLNGFINADKDFTVFTKLTVHQLLWGYVNPVLHIIKKSEYFFSLLKIKLPPINDVVALQYNGTEGAKHDGNLTISTGDDNVDNTQKFLKWKGLSDAPYWLTKYGEMLNGTDGTRFKLFLSRDDRLFVFNTQLCRSIYLEYDSDDSIMGVPLYRYSTTSYLFANSSVNPDNAAFCGPKRCYGSGLLPIGQCQTGREKIEAWFVFPASREYFGVESTTFLTANKVTKILPIDPPVFASAPHFYQGDKELLEAIDGLRPNKSLHGTFISVEPRTGMTFAAQKRLQINVMAQPNEYFDIMDPFKRNFTFLPLIWAQEGAVIDKANVEKFKDLVDTPKLILKWASNGIMILGAILVFIGLVLAAIRRRRRTRKYSVLKNENLDDGLSKVT